MNDLKFDKEMKELLCKYDYGYFVKQNIATENYNQDDVDKIYRSYNDKKKALMVEFAKNKVQYFHYLDGQVSKMFHGGLLTSLFNLNDVKQLIFLDFDEIGENWAYFELWRRRYKRKMTKKKLWTGIVSVGSILGIVLSILKILEVLFLQAKK